MCICVQVHKCTCLQRPEDDIGCLPQSLLPLFFLRQGLALDLELADFAPVATSNCQGSFCLRPLGTGSQAPVTVLDLFARLLGSAHLCDRPFSNSAISPVHKLCF